MKIRKFSMEMVDYFNFVFETNKFWYLWNKNMQTHWSWIKRRSLLSHFSRTHTALSFKRNQAQVDRSFMQEPSSAIQRSPTLCHWILQGLGPDVRIWMRTLQHSVLKSMIRVVMMSTNIPAKATFELSELAVCLSGSLLVFPFHPTQHVRATGDRATLLRTFCLIWKLLHQLWFSQARTKTILSPTYMSFATRRFSSIVAVGKLWTARGARWRTRKGRGRATMSRVQDERACFCKFLLQREPMQHLVIFTPSVFPDMFFLLSLVVSFFVLLAVTCEKAL